MNPTRQNKGATLIEVAVYSAVLLMLLAGIYTVVEGGMRYLRLADAGETVNQQAVIGLKKITVQLSTASQQSVNFGSAPQAHIFFLSPEPPEGAPPGYTFFGATSAMEWKKWTSIYRDGSRIVMVEQALLAPTYAPPVIDPANALPPAVSLPDFALDILSWGPQKPLANKVTDLVFNQEATNVYRVGIKTAVPTGTGKITEFELSSSVRLLNQ